MNAIAGQSMQTATRAVTTSTMIGRIPLKGVRRFMATSHDTGALMSEPQVTPLGVVKLVATVLPGLYVGASISKTCAAFLEENDIFVPADDDDDDD